MALAFTWHKEGGDSDGEIIHFDVEINSDHHAWATDGRADAYDLANAITMNSVTPLNWIIQMIQKQPWRQRFNGRN